ncbi:enoyl-CoA hydratase/isomerase family protein [Cupriavidus basilensis]
MKHLDLSLDGALATVTLSNPPQNRLGIQMLEELEGALATISDSGVRALLIRANGPDFSFGGDIMPWAGMTTGNLRSLFQRYMAVFNRIESLPCPTVAAVQGTCFGGGFELILRCDIILATSSARFSHPEQSLGITTLIGGVYRVAERAGRGFAAELAFTSDPVDAQTLHQRGVVNHVVDEGALEQEATELARRLAKGPTRAHAAHKAMLRLWALGGVQAADEAIFDIQMPLFETEDTKRGLQSAMDALSKGVKRPVLDFEGH